MMRLTDSEQAMLDGRQGQAKQKAMDLLVRYGEALGAERFVDTTNVAGVPGYFTQVLLDYYKVTADNAYDVIYSRFDLDSDEVVEVPRMMVNSCALQGGVDADGWETLGKTIDVLHMSETSEAASAARGIRILKTCTPYLAGNVPLRGEHCAWMESSAVVYCNSVLGARTNTEGRESTGAAALTGRIPYWGYHIADNRRGTHLVDIAVEVDDIMDWGLLGYYLGEIVDDEIPVLSGRCRQPSLIKLKHFGAAAASSGGVEMYHLPGVTPEARTVEEAFGGDPVKATIRYGDAERRVAYDNLNCATD